MATGFLYISDRKTDMVISGGVNIYPAEIEAELIMMPEVNDCVIFGVPHPDFGETLVGVIETQATLNEESVKRFLHERLAAYKIPRYIHFVSELPREDSGKIKKRFIKEDFIAQQSSPL